MKKTEPPIASTSARNLAARNATQPLPSMKRVVGLNELDASSSSALQSPMYLGLAGDRTHEIDIEPFASVSV